ncbi:MAG: HAMP domain-containing sensor histidine kinase, partial [Bacteroidales bacterium]|nr:HAMP domain-containing sensor histidine kinase [Bacteroidales bacterium]
VLLFEKWIEYVRDDFPYNTFRALILSVFFIAIIFSLILHQTDLFIASLAFPFIALIIARVKYTSVHGYRYVELVLLVFVFALYTTGLVYYYGELRSRQDRNILAMNLATERDEVAEYLLSELNPVLREDSVLHEMITKDDFSIEEINTYLTRQYFYGYWDKYSFQFIMCHPDDNLLLDPPSQQETPCQSFFYNMTVQKGVPLPNSDFYFIQNRNGRMTYLGSLNFEQTDRSKDISFFIELTSKYYTYEIGYPELLIERKISQNLSLSNYSYARYYQNLLIDNYGDFAYHRTDQIYGDIQPGTFKNVDFNDYHHTVYNAGDETLFVLSTPVASYWTLLITLSYVFLLFVLLASIFFIASHRKILYELIALNFQNKIQYSVLALMVLFTIIITGVSGSFLFQQSQRKHRDVITQKLQSIAIELNNAVGSEDWEYISRDQIESLLFDKARVYSTDINLYSPNGSLLASSRPEIFSKGLLGMQISPQIFQRLHFQGEMTIIGEEQVGSLKYISAYVPLTDQDNKVRGILNVPYFMKQNILTQEISTLLVTVLNLFILLFLLSVILSVIISRQLTHPLRILQQYLSRIQLSTQAEILEYSGKDEIGDLVRSYNHMVEELAHNVDRLAKSERESAWREMAKQIAHEIKNPLTPMKLNVQHIRRAKDQHNENFDVMFDRVTARLMEQIDLLSDIASQFSNFASMSITHQEKVNVVDRLDQVVQLFMNSQVEFVTEYDPSEVIWVWGDGKRITQVFTNLIKNGIQAIPPERPAVITVKVLKHGRQVWIRITDNGDGIPEEMMDKIFEPNFTTKTSGMGLGLAIVKSIVESLQGEITFTTEPGKGSSFLVRFSVYVEES